jgi:hypothetical protein
MSLKIRMTNDRKPNYIIIAMGVIHFICIFPLSQENARVLRTDLAIAVIRFRLILRNRLIMLALLK